MLTGTRYKAQNTVNKPIASNATSTLAPLDKTTMYVKASRTSHAFVFVICLLSWAGVWAFGSSSAKTDFAYSSYFDKENLALEHILNLDKSNWKPLDGNAYQVTLFEPQFWDLDDYPILWIKLEIPKRIKEDKLWLEIVPNTGVDGLLVQNIDNRWQWITAQGRTVDASKKVPSNYLTFEVNPKVEYKTAYLKLNTTQVFNFSINVYDQESWIWESLFRHLITGMVLGAVALAFCYNLAIGASAGERIYLVYSGYIASMFFYIVIYNGYLRLVFPDWAGQGIVARSSVYIVMYSAIAFIRDFFNTRYVGGWFDAIARNAQVLIVVSLLISLFINDFYAFLLNDAVSFISILIGLTAGIQALQRGHPLAKLFLLAWSIFLAGGLVWSLVWVGYAEPTTLPPNILLLGTALEVGLLSLMLGYRYSFLKETSERLNKQYQKYQDLSETDQLTGIYNRRGFLKSVELELAENPNEVVLLALDIDHFKRFNDLHGHLVGDKLLSEFGRMLKERSQREEFTSKLIVQRDGEVYRRSIAGRMGGEEFSILLINTSLNQAKLYADRLMKEFSELYITNDKGEKLGTTMSIGGTTMKTSDTIDSAWKRADVFLYEAKSAGRDQARISE